MRHMTPAVMLALVSSVCAADLQEDLSTVALLREGRALVPVRPVFEWLGAEVSYSKAVVTATRGDDTVTLTIGVRQAYRNGASVRLDAPAKIIDERTHVPLRFVAEAFGATVDYDPQIKTVTVTEGAREFAIRVVREKGAVRVYSGAWFDIEYPREFGVIEREESQGIVGHDGASFVSRDGAVEFYVLSPQWSADSDWASLRPGETQLTKHSEDGKGGMRLTWYVVQAPDASYKRAWVLHRNDDLNVNHYFGIKYPDEATYNRYKRAYTRFKESLVQYAD